MSTDNLVLLGALVVQSVSRADKAADGQLGALLRRAKQELRECPNLDDEQMELWLHEGRPMFTIERT